MPGKTSMAVAPAAGAGEPGSGSGETARHAAPRGAGRPSYELLSKYRGVLMGVQILLIMAFHYTEDLSNAADHFNGPAQVFYDYIGSSGVDMFLMISGLGLYYSWKRNPDAGAFYRKRLTRVLVPYVAVALVGWIWFDFVHSDAGVVRFLADIAFVTFFTDGVKWFWYIAVCLICRRGRYPKRRRGMGANVGIVCGRGAGRGGAVQIRAVFLRQRRSDRQPHTVLHLRRAAGKALA